VYPRDIATNEHVYALDRSTRHESTRSIRSSAGALQNPPYSIHSNYPILMMYMRGRSWRKRVARGLKEVEQRETAARYARVAGQVSLSLSLSLPFSLFISSPSRVSLVRRGYISQLSRRSRARFSRNCTNGERRAPLATRRLFIGALIASTSDKALQRLQRPPRSFVTIPIRERDHLRRRKAGFRWVCAKDGELIGGLSLARRTCSYIAV